MTAAPPSPPGSGPAGGLRPQNEAAPEVAALEVRQLSKAFTATTALDRVDLNVARGEVHALLGENGSGKSTLIKILAGYHTADDGEVVVHGLRLRRGDPGASIAAGCRFVHQDLGLVESLSVEDNLALSTGFPSRAGTVLTRELHARAVLDLSRIGLQVDPGTAVSSLSPAQKTGVAIARALTDVPGAPVRLLVLDEPTATLPAAEVHALLDVVRAVAASGVAVLYVTHRLEEVYAIADRLSVLRDGRKVVSAPVTELSRAALLTHLLGEAPSARVSAPAAGPAGDVALEVDGLRSGPLYDLSFSVRRGEVVGVAGLTGSGRESLLAAVFGGTPVRTAGTVRVAGRAVAPAPHRSIASGMAFLPADRKLRGGVMTLPARENLTLPSLASLWRLPALRRGREREEAAHWFEQLQVRPRGAAEKHLGTFSGGNQQKVLISKWFRCGPAVLLLDEPTQGVDVGAKAEIHRQVTQYARSGSAVVVASSDLEELTAICGRVLVLRDGRLSAMLSGDEVTVAALTTHALVEHTGAQA